MISFSPHYAQKMFALCIYIINSSSQLHQKILNA